jgi:hypothetical protein
VCGIRYAADFGEQWAGDVLERMEEDLVNDSVETIDSRLYAVRLV